MDNLAPAAPTAVIVGDRPGDQGDGLVLSWAANAEADLAGYHVYRSTAAGGPYARANAVVITATTYTDTGLSSGVTYYYVVRAEDVHANESAASIEVSAAPVDNLAPAAPAGLVVTDHPGDQGGALDLVWTANAEADLAGYNVYRATTSGGSYTRMNTAGLITAPLYTDTTVIKNVAYFYVVKAVDIHGNEGPASAEATGTPRDNTPPAPPMNLVATDHPGDQGDALDLVWTPSASGDVLEQRIYRATTSGGSYTLVATLLNNTASAYTDSGLTAGATYYYVIRAFDGANESANSNQTSAVPVDNQPPAPPTGVTVTDRPADQGDALIVSWNANSEADLAGYDLYRATNAAGPWTQVNSARITATSYTDTGLTRGVTYYYYVTAVDTNANESAPSATVSGAPLDNVAPATPTGLTVTDHPYDAGTALDLAWTANTESDLAGYHVYRALSALDQGTRVTTSPVTGTRYTDTGLTVNVTYYYRITAMDTSGNESVPSSPPVSGVPLPDVTPPAQVTNFTASDGEPARVTLSWTHPADLDLAQVVVKRKSGSYPASHLDGVTVYDNQGAVPGRNAAFVDGGLAAGTYYYAVYSRDVIGNWNDATTPGANADTGTPVAAPFSPIVIELASQADVTANGVIANDQSGFAVANDGDLNGDGVNDVVIGAENAGNVSPCPPEFLTATLCPRGEARVVFGGAGLGGTMELSSAALVVTGINPGDRLGTAVANAGDLDGDGVADLVIGARQADRVYPPPTNTGNEGRVYVFFSRASYPSPVTADQADLIIGGPSLNGEAGSYLSTDGDLNGDGIKDLVIGAPKASGGNGAVYVLFGRASWASCRTSPCTLDLATQADVTIIGYRYAQFDFAQPEAGRVATGGDLNGDGLSDLVIGASGFSPPSRASAGAAFVILGRPTFPLTIDLQSASDVKIYGATVGDQFGSAVSVAGDVDGDGLADLAIGAQQADPGGRSNAGRVYVLKGKASYSACMTTPCVVDLAVTPADLTVNGIDAGDQLAKANALDTAGDVNGDGIGDMVIGALAADPGSRTNTGQAYALFGRNPLPATIELSAQADVTMNGILAGDSTGYAVSSGGSIKGRACKSGADIVIGADAADPGGRVDAGQTFAVYGPFTALPPILNGIGDLTVNEGATVAITITACDPNGDPIAFAMSPPLVFGSFVDNGNGTATLTLTPGYSDAGAYTLTVTAADNGVPPLVDSETFTIRVLDVNRPPTLDPIGNQTVDEGAVTDVIITASDADGGTLIFAASNLPAFATFTDNGNGTARLRLSPGYADVGVYPGVTVSVSDSADPPLFDGETFSIIVANVNRAPVLAAIADLTIDEGTILDVSISATDPDGDVISFTASSLPAFATLTDHGNGTATLRLAPDYTHAGIYPGVTITATDAGNPALSVSQTITITVNDVNRAPLLAPIGDLTVDEATTRNVPITATDPDGDTVTLSASNLPAFATFTPTGNGTGTLTLSPGYLVAGAYDGATVTATDNGAPVRTTTETFRIVVVDTPPAAPAGLTAVDRPADEGGAIVLSWASNTEGDLAGYHVYRRSNPADPFVRVTAAAVTGTTYTDTGLTNGVAYEFTVRAVDAGNHESAASSSAIATAVDNLAPAAPTGLAAVPGPDATGGTVALSWNANVEPDVIGYTVLRSQSDVGPYTAVNAVPVVGTTYTDGGLTNGVTYYYRVTALDGTNTSAPSNTASATPVDRVPPAAPTGVAAADRPSDQGGVVVVSWAANTDADLAGYHVYRAAMSGGVFTRVNPALITAASYTDAGLVNGTTYYYVVRAQDTSGNESADSVEVSVAPVDNIAPLPPTALAVSDHPADQGGALDLAWTASASTNVAGYHVYRSLTSGTGYVRLTTAPLAGSTFTDTGLTDGIAYFYVVRAVDSANESADSNEASGAPADNVPPAAPTGVTAADRPADQGGAVVIIWSANAESDLAGYNLYRSLTSGGSYSKVNAALLAGLSFTDTGLTNGTIYFYVVRAVDTSGNESANSAQASAVPIDDGIPTAPTNVTASDQPNDEGGTILLSWSANPEPDLAGYNLYRSTIAGGPYVKLNAALLTGTSMVDASGLSNGTRYYYVLRAVDTSANESVNSAEASAVPADNLAPLAPSDLTAADRPADGGGAIVLAWSASASTNVVGYVVLRGTVSGGPYTPLSPAASATTFTDTGLTDGTTYYYRVRALDGANQSPDSNEASAAPINDLGAPAVPAGLSASDAPNDDGGALILTWQANTEPTLAGYNLYRGATSGGPYPTRVNASLITATTFTDTGLTNGTTSYYVLTAVNTAALESAPSAQASAAPVDNLPPAPPTGLAAADAPNDEGTALTLSWIASASSDVLGYYVYRSTTSGTGYVRVNAAPVSATTYTDSGLTRGTPYYYVVRAIDGTNEGAPSAEASGIPIDNLAPSAPTGLAAADRPFDEGGAVVLSWTPSASSDVVAQRLYRSATAGGPWTPAATFADRTTDAYTDVGLANGSPSYYVIRAFDGVQESADSNQASAVPLDNTAPPQVIDFSASDGEPVRSTLRWTNPAAADLAEVLVTRKTGSYPASHLDAAAATVYDNTSPAAGAPVSAADTGLTGGTTYFYAVFSRDASGNWNDAVAGGLNADTGAPTGTADTTPPAAPTGLTATDRPGDQGGAIDLTWAANTEPDLAGYVLYRALVSGGSYTRLNAVLLPAPGYTDSGVSNGTTYFYVASAVDASGNESARSAQASAAPIDNLPPAAPTGLTAVDRPGDEGGAVDLAWTPSSSADITAQRVYRSATSGGSYTLVATIAGNTAGAATDTGLVNGATYYYVLRAFDGTSESADSNQASAAPIDNLPPAQVANFTAADTEVAQSTLTWTNPGAPDLGEVLVSRKLGGYPTGHADAGAVVVYGNAAPIPGAAVSVTDAGLTNGTLYYYAVYARDRSGNWNDATTAGLNADTALPRSANVTPPAAPTGLAAADRPADQGGVISLAWAANTEPDLAGYNVYRSLVSGGSSSRLNGALVVQTTYEDAGLANGTAYFYVVRAVDASGNESAASNEASAAPADNLIPAAPASLSAADRPADLGGAVTLAWTPSASTDVIEQRIYRAAASGGPYAPIGTASASTTAFTDAGLTDGTTYFYVVRAYDGTSESANSNEASATPRANALEFLHQEPSAIGPGYLQLKQDAPGAAGDPVSASASYQTINLANEVPGSFFIQAFESQTNDPGAAVTIPAGSVFRVLLYMDQTTDAAGSGTIYPKAFLALVDSAGTRTTFCMADDATNPGLAPLTATTTAVTLNCLNAAPLTLTPSDRLWLWTGVRLATPPTINVSARLFIEGTAVQPPAYQSRLTIPWHETTAPGAVATLSAADRPNDNGDAIDLAWSANTTDPDVAGYTVYRSTVSGGSYTRINAYPITGTSYTDTGLSWGVTYYYVVRAYDTSGNESADSIQAVATTIDTIPPPGITDFLALDGADGQSPLSWTNPVDAALGEVIVLRSTAGYPAGHADPDPGAVTVYRSTTPVSGGTVSVVDPGLTNGTTYYYAVYARDAAGNWNDATTAGQSADTAVPSNVAPATPTALAAADQAGDQGGVIVLTWTPSTSPGILDQRVYRSTADGGPYTLIQTIGDNTTQVLVDVGLVNGVTYYYVVRAFNGTRDSADSTQASAAPIDNLAPLAPTALAAVDTPNDEGGSIDLTWTPSTSVDVIQQRVYRSTTAGGGYTPVQTIAGRTTSAYTDTGLVNGTTYYYVIAAFDGSQESPSSNEASAAPIDTIIPPAPLNVMASDRPADQGGALDLFWTPSTATDVTEQRVYRSSTTGGSYMLVTTIPDNTTNAYTDVGLTNGAAYYYVVRAFDGTQESADSNEASAAPIDNLAPTAPSGLSATDAPADSGGAIALAWTPSTSTDVTQQRVYRSLTSGGPYGPIASLLSAATGYTDSGLTNGTTYYYVIAAFDGTQEGPSSTEAFTAPADNRVVHLHDELSALSAARQLRQAGPDVAATTVTSGDLVSQTGVFTFANFETQTGDPNANRTLAAGATFSFTIYMQTNSGTMVPYVALYKNSAIAGNLICSASGATPLTTTMTAYTLNCSVGAGGLTLVPSDRFYLSVGVNISVAPTVTTQASLGIEGVLNGATDSRMVVPWP